MSYTGEVAKKLAQSQLTERDETIEESKARIGQLDNDSGRNFEMTIQVIGREKQNFRE